MNKNILLPLLFLSLFLCNAFAQQGELFNFKLDWAQFRMDDDNSYIEFYYAYSTNSLRKKTIEEKQYSELFIRFLISDNVTNDVVIDRMWKMQHVVDNATTDNIQISQTRFILPNSAYEAKIFLMDLNNISRTDSITVSFKTPNYPNDVICLSDIQFCSSIKQIEKDTTNIFYKNTFEVKPNPFNLVDIEYPVLSYYLEVYNLSTEKLGEKLTTKYSILSLGKERMTKSISKPVKNGNSVEVGVVNIQKLVGGAYDFVFSIMDESGNLVAKNSKRFYLYNPDAQQALDDAIMPSDDEFAIMTEEQLDLLQQQSICLSSRDEQVVYKKLSGANAKQNYMRQFWYVRRHDPLYNKSSFMERLEYVNNKYRTKFSQGWNSDRGRVALQYGIPLESYIERGKETTNGKPYEVWFYPEVLNGVYFVFADETGFGKYMLMHSTHPNEPKDNTWQEAVPGFRNYE